MIKAKSATWYECKISYEKTMEDGTQKKVKETYTVDALSFTEAESKISEEMSSYISGGFTVENINKASYSEIFFSDSDSADKWYKSKTQYITLDEKTAKEKRSNVYNLVQAGSIKEALKNLEEVLNAGMADVDIVSIADTAIMDVFEH